MTETVKQEIFSKGEIIALIAEKHGVSKRLAGDIVNDVFENVIAAVADGKRVQIAGFGSFSARERAARTGRNPQTGEELAIPATITPGFKAGKVFKDAVKN